MLRWVCVFGLLLGGCVVKEGPPPAVAAAEAGDPAAIARLQGAILQTEALGAQLDGVDARARLELLRDLATEAQRLPPRAQAPIAAYVEAALRVEARALPQEAPILAPEGQPAGFLGAEVTVEEGVVATPAPPAEIPTPPVDPRAEALAALRAQDPARAVGALSACAEGGCDAERAALYDKAVDALIRAGMEAAARLRRDARAEPDVAIRADMLATVEADLELLLRRFPAASAHKALLAERDAVRAEVAALTAQPAAP